MKKISFLMFVLFALLLKVNAQEPKFASTEKQNRNVIIEEFTGRSCGYCPEGHVVANNLVKNNPGRVWAVNIHSGGYAETSYPNFITEDGDIIRTTIHTGGYPSGAVNRSTAESLSRGEWSTHTTTQMSQTAECNVAGQVVINHETRIATIAVEVYYTGNSLCDKNYLTIMMLQDNIVGSQSGSSANPSQVVSGGYNHMHVLRDIITPTWGEEIAPTTYGTLISKIYSYQIPEVIGAPNGVTVDLDNIVFLALVTEKQETTNTGTSTRPILNINELTITDGYDVEATAKVNPANSGTVNGTGTYTYGDYATLKAEASQGYKFFSWTKNGEQLSKSAEYTYVITEDTELVANFVSENSYYITAFVDPTDAGAITGDGSYQGYEIATLLATPSEGYRFVNWTENGEVVSTDAEYSFEVTCDRNLVANFTLLDYDVEVAINSEGVGEVTVVLCEEGFEGGSLPQAWDVYSENQLNPSDKPNDTQGWKVVESYSSLEPKDGKYYAASVSEWYYDDARFYLVTSKMKVPANGMMKFCYVNPKKKNDYGEWSSRCFLYVSDSPIGPWTELWSTVQNKVKSKWTDVEVDLSEYVGKEVYFAFANKYNGYGSWTAVDNVKISGSTVSGVEATNVGNYLHGDVVTLKATAMEGYRFFGWMENGNMVSTDAQYTFTVTDKRDLVATFVSENACLITASVNPEEAGTITGCGAYDASETVALTATANEGYEFVNWTEDGNVVSEDAEYSFTVTKDRSLVANFEKIIVNYNVTVTINPEEAGTITGAGTYAENEEVTLTATANENYKFVNWTEDGEVVSENAEYSFTITGDRNLVANFVSTEGVEELSSLFRLYPNPVNDKLYIVTEVEIEEVVVYDVYGRQQFAISGQQSAISVTNLNSGFYFVKVVTNDGEVVKRFVKK